MREMSIRSKRRKKYRMEAQREMKGEDGYGIPAAG